MIDTKVGHIVTVSSVTGLLGTYACTDYSATKFACVGFHESLYTELHMHGQEFVRNVIKLIKKFKYLIYFLFVLDWNDIGLSILYFNWNV